MCIRDSPELDLYSIHIDSMGIIAAAALGYRQVVFEPNACTCLLYTSDAADERSSVDLGGRRIIKKKND